MRACFFLLLLAVFLLLPGQANASYWFQVIDITPVEMLPNSEANFTVSVKGLGSDRAYVELVFRNVSKGRYEGNTDSTASRGGQKSLAVCRSSM